MISFHVGVPGIFDGMSEHFWASNHQAHLAHAHPVSPQSFVEYVRPYLIGRRKDQDEFDDLKMRALDCISYWPKNDPIAISDPLLLGGASDFLRAGPCFPNSERIVSRVCALFKGWELRFHLAITNQFDAIWLQPHVPIEQRVQAVRLCDFSWANLVWRLRRGCPGARIVVWDSEHPELLVSQLRLELGGGRRLIHRLTSDVGVGANRDHQLAISQHFLRDDYPKIDLLDRRYEEDLFKIASLSRVSLFSGEDHFSAEP